jgi:hypothetical protein
VSVVTLHGCGGDAEFTPPPAANTVYWRVSLDRHAVTLTLNGAYDTLTLVPTPRTVLGDVWSPGTDSVPMLTTFTSTDSSRVSVSDDGLLTARALGTNVRVIVKQQVGNVTTMDTAMVSVTAPAVPQTLTTFSIRPTDSTKRALGTVWALPIVALDQDDQSLGSVLARYNSSDTTVARFSNAWSPVLAAGRVGSSLISATTWIHGVVKTDTFTLTVGYGLSTLAIASAQPVEGGGTEITLTNTKVNLGPGADMGFRNNTNQPIDIIFDDPAKILGSSRNTPPDLTAGNILSLPGDTTLALTARTKYRKILIPGTYEFHVEPGGATGTIIIHDQ